MKSRVLFLLALLAGSVNILAQNLVPNGSFEEGTNCPSFNGNLNQECLNWFSSIQYEDSSNNPTPEWYFNCGDAENLTPPDVAFGYQVPLDGEGYAGIVVFNDQFGVEESYREPIGVELINPLVAGSTYLVEFSIVRLYSAATALAADNFGFKFTNTATYNADSLIIDNTAAFKIDTIVSDTMNWLSVSTEYIADSDYAYIHFGNFFNNENSDFIADGAVGTISYLALDAISITEIATLNVDAIKKEQNISLYPNPTSSNVLVDSNEGIIEYALYTISGTLIKSFRIYNKPNIAIEMNNFPSGTYFLKITTTKSIYYENIIKI